MDSSLSSLSSSPKLLSRRYVARAPSSNETMSDLQRLQGGDDVSPLVGHDDDVGSNNTPPNEDGIFHHPNISKSSMIHNRIACWGQLLGMIACVMAGILIGSFDTLSLKSTATNQSSSPRSSLWSSSSSHFSSSWTNSFAILSTDASSTLALRPGELPGYTGWARPEFTLAGHFELIQTEYLPRITTRSSSSHQQNQQQDEDETDATRRFALGTLRLVVHCATHEQCHQGGALFYLRMYGPAVITGLVEDYKNGTYQCTFEPMDAGIYTVEVVMTYSHPPSFDEFPLPANAHSTSVAEPQYEGHLLAGFPLVVQIPSSSSSRRRMHTPFRALASSVDQTEHRPRRHCTTVDLTETSLTSAYHKARWVVTDRVNQARHELKTTLDSVSLEQYQWSLNGLGIQMEYQYHDCDILPDTTNRFTKVKEEANALPALSPTISLPACLQQSDNSNMKLQYLFIGDSNLRLQKEFLESYLSQLYPDGYSQMIQVTLIELFGGMLKCRKEGRPNVAQLLEKRARRQKPGQRLIIIFNSGLHDIHRLCGQQWKDDRATYLDIPDVDLSCPQLYREALVDLVRQVANTPATLRIFQTTTAGWPKYGNVGVTWPTDNPQQMPLSPDFVSRFNDIAFDVLRGGTEKHADHELFAKTIHITDGYWITIPRPDHREVDEVSSIGKKLAHPGVEILSVMNRILLTFVLEALGCVIRN